MRGYDALVLVDVSRQGGEPGTLYVMEPDEEDIAAGIEDGEMIDPHGMDPQTVLRFVRPSAAGRARSSSSPASRPRSRRWAWGSRRGRGGGRRAVDLVLETVAELDDAPTRPSWCTSSP